MPHMVRVGLSECLGLEQSRIRVIAPDVGGGFGYKCILLPEEVCLSWLALCLDHPIRWIEDRREQLTAGANCREHHYRITAHADRKGRILALDAEAAVDSGAYSVFPFTCLEAAQLPSMLPGPYRIPTYRCRTYAVASNKVPLVPYRGVARPGACLALELIVDAVARAANREPYEVRIENLVPPEAMPFDNVTGKHFDSGDYPECLRRAVAAIDVAAIRKRQRRARAADDSSEWASVSLTNNRLLALQYTRHGDCPWCPVMSPPTPGLCRTACWNYVSEFIPTAKGWKQLSPRSLKKFSASISTTSGWCTAIPQ